MNDPSSYSEESALSFGTIFIEIESNLLLENIDWKMGWSSAADIFMILGGTN